MATGTNDRVTNFGYDFRDRQVTVTDATLRYQVTTYDNLSQPISVALYSSAFSSGSSSSSSSSSFSRLLSRNDSAYDDRGQVYLTTRWEVDPNSGALGHQLLSNTWRDSAGNVIKSLPAGSQAFTKLIYDGLARQIASYTGYYGPGGTEPNADAGRITQSDIIFEQSINRYDDASNVTLATGYQRHHDATGGGPLNLPTGQEPRSRVSYLAAWYDGIGRQITTANYGTNDDVPLVPPA